MTKKVNSTDKPYHHGNLRETLLSEATQLLAEAGVEGLSVRKLADRVGVSRAAPYHHFRDKNALLCAIAEQGFRQQDELLRSAVRMTGMVSPAQQFEGYVMTYLQFADEHQQTFDLMFGREIWRSGKPTASLQEVSRQSFRLWLNWVEALQVMGLFDPDLPAVRVAQSSWAALHGLCRLFNDGVYVDRQDLTEIAQTTVRLLIQSGRAHG